MNKSNRSYNACQMPHHPFEAAVWKSAPGIPVVDSHGNRRDFATGLGQAKFSALRNQMDYVMAKITSLN